MELTQQQIYDIRPSEVVAVEHDEEGLSHVWFADRQPNDIRYVCLTRAPSSQDVYTERDDQKWSCYGGVLHVSFDADKLVVDLDKSAAKALGGVESVRVDCRGLNEETSERVEKALRAIFDGTSVPLTIL
jgi:hypothetical protein